MIKASHQQIPVYNCLARIRQQRQGKPESRIFLHPVGVERNHGNVALAGFVKRTADKSHIVACPAAAACLRHHDSQLVRVIPAGEHRIHNLSNRDNGGITGIVVDKFQPHINSGTVIVLQNNQMIAMLSKHLLQNVEVNRTHLGCKDSPSFTAHFRTENRSVVGSVSFLRDNSFFLPLHHGRQQTPDADSRCAEVVDFVNFQHGIHFPAAFKDFADLVCRNGVQPASERIELHQLQILP